MTALLVLMTLLAGCVYEVAPPSAPPPPEQTRYRSMDDLMLSGLMCKPAGDPPWPTIIVNHPAGHEAEDMRYAASEFTSRGYLVFCPDYRGCGDSEGEMEWAAGEVGDVLAAIEYLELCGLTDGRIGLYGVSHGAAISVLAASREPEIDAVVAESGFYDMKAFYDYLTWGREDFALACGGTPEQVPEEYRRRSAIEYADGIDCPVFITHGKLDLVVPYGQAVDMYDALIAAGKPAAIALYEDEGHWIFRPEYEGEYLQAVLRWFDHYLGN